LIAVVHHLVLLLHKELVLMVHLLAMMLPPKEKILKRIDTINERQLLSLEGFVAALKMADIFRGFGKDSSLSLC
jgi:hypothetical protein